MDVNGKEYPFWGQFVERKEEWIGGFLEDFGDTIDAMFGINRVCTEITDIQLTPNGRDSAMFSVVGKDFICAFDVHYGAIKSGEEGYITFSGYGGHTWRIAQREKSINA